MNLTIAQLLAILPKARPIAGRYLDWLNLAMVEFDITTPERQAAFLSQVGTESGQLTCVEENLNYGAAGLLATWKKHFSPADAQAYARQPERIANRAYANRGGNGDEASGDGWRFRGAGLIQLTFRDNQAACAAHFGITTDIGDWLRTPEGACRSAGWFWQTHGLNALADAGNIDAISDIVNLGHRTTAVGDSIGWAERLALFNTGNGVLA